MISGGSEAQYDVVWMASPFNEERATANRFHRSLPEIATVHVGFRADEKRFHLMRSLFAAMTTFNLAQQAGNYETFIVAFTMYWMVN